MRSVDYKRHSRFSDPGRHAGLLRGVSTEMPELAAVARNVIVHYRAEGIAFAADRLAEINNRWMERILDCDQSRFPVPLDVERPLAERVPGCCRDHSLFVIAVLRENGIPARSRVGFASYFTPGFHHDHVVAEYWNGERWVWMDPELKPEVDWPFQVGDIPPDGPHFVNAARVWTAFRRGEIDPRQYGVGPGLPIGGDWFIYDYVFQELAHRMGDELLLWDAWGAQTGDFTTADVDLADAVAALVIAADGGEDAAERELADRYASDPRLKPGDSVLCLSPDGNSGPVALVSQ